MTEEWLFDLRQGYEIFLFSKVSNGIGAHSASYSAGKERSFLEGKTAGA
jgi:hypothetical protein